MFPAKQKCITEDSATNMSLSTRLCISRFTIYLILNCDVIRVSLHARLLFYI